MNEISARLVSGHRVASGQNEDPRFPGGTVRMQIPHFLERGLDLQEFHPATLNLSIAPLRFEILRPRLTFRNVKWHPTEPAEDFSFFECWIRSNDAKEAGGGGKGPVEGWIYYPHPETKPEHFQESDILEVIAKTRIPAISYGDELLLETDPQQIRFQPGAAEA